MEQNVESCIIVACIQCLLVVSLKAIFTVYLKKQSTGFNSVSQIQLES